MTSSTLSVLYADSSAARAARVAAALRSLGHEVVLQDDAQGCLAAPEAGLYLLGATLPDRSSGLDLLEALRRTGRNAPCVLLHDAPDFEAMRRAVELDASDVLFEPLTPEALVRALAKAGGKRAPAESLVEEEQAHALERRYPAEPDSVGRAAREVSAFLVNEGVASAHRVRIASALAELTDNACRHAYGKKSGEVRVEVALQGARVQLVVEDSGPGFDVAAQRLERVPPALPGRRLRAVASSGAHASSHHGLGRVERLCESHTITSGPKGTRAELTFELTPVRFEEEAEHLGETDFLDPERARGLIESLRQGSSLEGLAPSMALTVGRILGGLQAESRPKPVA
ncbi:MAG TPA: ATP-binding protein [Planctomycetota bacterium]